MVGFYSTRGSPPVMVDLQVKVVDSLSPCFRGDFPESVTTDRYVTSEWSDLWNTSKTENHELPITRGHANHPPKVPRPKLTALWTPREHGVKTLLLSVLDLRTWYKWYILSLRVWSIHTWYSQRLVLLSDRTKDLVFPKRKTTTLSNSLVL